MGYSHTIKTLSSAVYCNSCSQDALLLLLLLLRRPNRNGPIRTKQNKTKKKEAGPDLTVTTTWQIYNDVAVVFLGQEAGSRSPRNEQQDNTAFNRLRQTDRLSDRLDRQV